MKIALPEITEEEFPHFKGGENSLFGKMVFDGITRILDGKLKVGSTIGVHTHDTSSEVIYILSGEAKVLIDDGVEYLKAGECHYCPKGHTHSLHNNSETDDLLFFAVITEHN